jgi:hypothetical protein
MAEFRIIPCDEWGAAPPRQPIAPAGTPVEIIFHHTAGHHPELDLEPTESREEAMAYARAIQRDHMHRTPPFIDSGHNFLVTRSGHILEGRHGSRDAINAGRMVVSAHCVGHNSQPGIEHEHLGTEPMTRRQRRASVWLIAKICRKTGIDPREVHPHGEFNATECPGVLRADLEGIRADVAIALAQHPAPV